MRRNNLNLRHLRAFQQVADHQSISKAAKIVHLSQPAVTQAIAKLEAKLEVVLFDRTGNGLFITPAGTIFLRRVERALTTIADGARLASKTGRSDKSQNQPRAKGFSHFDRLATTAQLASLLAVAQAGNFSLAARNTDVSQPSLHRTARDLERLCGLALFNKTNIGIELTPAATTLARYVRLAFGELDQGLEEIENWRGTDTGHIVIGTMPLARTFILPRAINALLKIRPDVNVSVIDGPYDDLLQGLRHGDTDLLVGALRDPVPVSDVIQEALFNDSLAIVGRAGHPLFDTPNLDLGLLAQFPWVVPRGGTPTRAVFDELFQTSQNNGPDHVIETSSLVLIRGLLLESDRLTILSAHQMRQEEEQGLFRRLDFEMNGTARDIGVTFRQNWHPTKTQTLFLDLLRQAGQCVQSAPRRYWKNE